MNTLQKTYKKEIEELVEACHRCAELNYVTSSGGNLSLRLDGDKLLITPTKTLKRTMHFEETFVHTRGNKSMLLMMRKRIKYI